MSVRERACAKSRVGKRATASFGDGGLVTLEQMQIQTQG